MDKDYIEKLDTLEDRLKSHWSIYGESDVFSDIIVLRYVLEGLIEILKDKELNEKPALL